MEVNARNESEIFADLEKLCTSQGYVHVIAYFCFIDNTTSYADRISPEDLMRQLSPERLVRTEISTLVGLMFKQEIDFSIPDPEIFQGYIDSTKTLLEEIHHSMMAPVIENIIKNRDPQEKTSLLSSGLALREPIFYSGESAYYFQYRDFLIKKYGQDSDWFVKNKGYSIEQACLVIKAIENLHTYNLNQILSTFDKQDPSKWTVLPAFVFTVNEIATELGIRDTIVQSVISSFVPPDGTRNEDFLALGDFNITNAYPIIPYDGSGYILFHKYSLAEAFYETPFFWFNDDIAYKDIATKHRGEFTEKFSAERLKLVFGEDRVFENINIVDSRGKTVGEIDVLVVFANRAIVLQAKSKKLTIPARKGNDNCLRSDFKKAVQNAYDQAFSCAELLTNCNYRLEDCTSSLVEIRRDFSTVYLFCVVSDHYPALSFQAGEFLNCKKTDEIMYPFIMDVFLLDAMTEMLQTPLYFLSYVDRRTGYAGKINSMHELTVLAYHLKYNLWMDGEHNFIHLHDDICADLDLAMLTRRDGLPGIATPEGILTRFKDTAISKIISEIETSEDPDTIDLGFMLLLLNEDTMKQISSGIEEITKLVKKDGNHHNITIGMEDGSTGLTIHCNPEIETESIPQLKRHCNIRKYIGKANTWFGICLDPQSTKIKFVLKLDNEWKYSEEMEAIVKNRLKPQRTINFSQKAEARKKVGRNEPCNCGSGKKYKKCCLNSYSNFTI
ncbi:SEC-C metal-binding domain-containing protein [Chamaesiphon sp.]|uniref:SEC-C metal-binding domain-containing protein n=1 Tax=Chamaesiphon sp. TaxID=2814140 RepID=UPI00359382B9